MSTVEKVKKICKSRKIPISRLEKDLGFSNGYINQLRKGTFPSDRLALISKYLDISISELIGDDINEPIEKPKGVQIPVLGDVAAGIPIEAIEDIIDYEEIDENLARKGEFFGLRIKGNSMSPRIQNGDVVIVRVQPDAESGDIVIAKVNGDDACCKKLQKHDEGISLISLNPEYEPMFFSKKDIADLPVHIIGKVVELRGKF